MTDEAIFGIASSGNGDSFAVPAYETPYLFSEVGLFLEKITFGRNSGGTQDFVWDDFNTSDYVSTGVIGIVSLVGSVVLIWMTALIVLKCMGRGRVGCAAGFPFHDETSNLRRKSLLIKDLVEQRSDTSKTFERKSSVDV